MNKRWIASVALGLFACSDSESADGRGTVRFTTWGEELIEQEIPASEVEDGWVIRYDRFLVVLSDVSVAEENGPTAASMATPLVFNLKNPGEKPVVSFSDLPGKPYPRVSYRIAPAAAPDLAPGATEADRTVMTTGGYSLYVEATATKGAIVKRFTWGFRSATAYERCKGEISGKETDGVVVTNGGVDAVQLTIHGDHLFYDDLQSQDAKVRFDNLAAADANGDGEITLDELAGVDLADRSKIKEGPYGTGSAAGINDLRAFVEALSRTVGHFRGEGECLARSL